jgi:ribonucleoside-diphosphate reductase alpha chain
MQVRKRSGVFEDVELGKIELSLKRYCGDLPNIDVYRIASKTVGGLVDGVSTLELDMLSVRTAKDLIIDDPVYSKVAARILANVIQKEVAGLDIQSFSQSIELGFQEGLISETTHALVLANKRKLNAAIKHERDWNMEFHGLQTVYDRYVLKHPTLLRPDGGGKKQRAVIETPQYFFMRVACGLADDALEVIEMYNLLSSLEYMCSTPTLFNSGTTHSQMSSCYLLSSPIDSLDTIYKAYSDIALLSKFAGGIGVSLSGIRGRDALIRGTNGKSNGIVPWAHTLSASVGSCNQGGKRKGAAAIYLEPHHPDIMQFLELKDNSGEREQRAYNLNLANWVSDLFMKRVKEDGIWSLFDATVASELIDLYGDAYEVRYLALEALGRYTEQLPARKVYARMMRSLAETGNGWMCFKDTCNRRGNQVNDEAGTMIHLSNLCSEILEVTSSGKRRSISRAEMDHLSASNLIEKSINITGFNTKTDSFDAIDGAEISVCNLGSINLARGYIKHGKLDKEKLRKNVAIGVKYLDRVINRNFYPVVEAEASNMRWRPVGLGLMGLADFFMQLRIPFDSEQAIKLSAEIQEEIYYQALKTSCELAQELAPHRDFHLTRAAKGDLQFDLAGVTPEDMGRWDALKSEIRNHGLRNSLTIAIAPTACQAGTNIIQTELGPLSLYDILDQNEIAYAEIEDANQPMWVNIKPLNVPTLQGMKVCDKIWFNGAKTVYTVTYESGHAYEYTANHRLYVNRRESLIWADVRYLSAGFDNIVTHVPGAEGQVSVIASVQRGEIKPTWDIEVEDAHHYLMENGTVSHNTISHICGAEECIEPIKSNLLKRETLSGEFISVNKYLVEDLRKLGKWNAETIAQLKIDEGSIANIVGLPPELYANYKTVWEMSMKSLISHAVARGAYIDQSHSLNMFIDLNKYPEEKRIGVLSSLYMHAWESGLKTTYYFRSRAATRIQQTTVRAVGSASGNASVIGRGLALIDCATAMAPEDAEVCESCQ